MVLALLFLVAADVLVFLTGERSAFLLLTISTLIIITCIKRFKILRLITFILSSIIIIIITLNVPLVKERNIDYTISQLGIDDGNINAFSAEHQRYFKTSIEMFLDSPFFDMELKCTGLFVKTLNIKFMGMHATLIHTTPIYNYLLRLVFLVLLASNFSFVNNML